MLNASSKLAIQKLTYQFEGSACESLEAIEYAKNLDINNTEPLDGEGTLFTQEYCLGFSFISLRVKRNVFVNLIDE